jgi:hypothetical protein
MVTLRKVGVGGLGWIGLFCLLLLGTGCSRRPGNAQVTSDVQNRIRTDGRMQLARVQVIATNGVVTLSGYVTSSGQRAATVQDAAQIQGVRLVIDNLRIIDPNPPSPTIAMQKPSASVARLPRPARVPITFEADTAQPTRPPPAPDRTPVGQTTGVSAPPAVPGPGDAHAIAAKTSGSSDSLLPVSAPPVPSPAAALPPVAPLPVTVPYGTELVVRLTESLSSDVNEKGDTFLASLSSPIMIGDRVVIPAEAGLEGKVVEVQSAGRFSGRPRVAVEITRLTYNGKTYKLRSGQYSKQGASRDSRSLAAIGGGAGVGAIIGAILGGGRGAAIGSVIGAGAGTGVQAASKAAPVQLPAESVLSFRLQAPLTVIPSSTLQTVHGAGPGSPPDPFSSDDDRPVLKRRPGSPPPETDAPEANPHSDNK